jgi:hypothetical protein
MTHVRILMPCYERPELATMMALLAETHDLRDHNIEWSIDVKHGIYPTALACNHGAFHALANTPSTWSSPAATKTPITHVLIWGADNYPIDRGAIRALLAIEKDIVGSTIACKSDTPKLGFQPLDEPPKTVPGAMQVKRCGSGFMLVTQRALSEVAEAPGVKWFISHYPQDERRALREVFKDDVHPETSEWTPEDYYFCDLATKAGFEIWMQTTTRHGHIGKKDFRVRG